MADPAGLYRTTEGRYHQVSVVGPDLMVRVFDADLQDAMLPTPLARAQLDHQVQQGRWERCDSPWVIHKAGLWRFVEVADA